MASTAAMASGVTAGCAWPDRGDSVTELRRLGPSYSIRTLAVMTDMHHHTELPFINEFLWISPLHLIKNKWQYAVPLCCMLQVGQPSLHYCCAVMLRSSIILPPVSHSSNHEYHCCQLKEQLSSVSNFYHTFKVFIWLCLISSYSSDIEGMWDTTLSSSGVLPSHLQIFNFFEFPFQILCIKRGFLNVFCTTVFKIHIFSIRIKHSCTVIVTNL
jgi:hypothetical protein